MKLWCGFIIEELAASKAFYQSLFECEVIYESDWFLLLSCGKSELGFMLPEQASQHPMFQQPYQQGAWLTFEVADAITAHQRIQALNIPIQQPLKDEPWGDRHFAILDPNGIGIDIVQRIAE